MHDLVGPNGESRAKEQPGDTMHLFRSAGCLDLIVNHTS